MLTHTPAALADAMFDLDIPVVIILQGGRPFAIPDYYDKSAAVINAVSSVTDEEAYLAFTDMRVYSSSPVSRVARPARTRCLGP